jgi:site-specific recombinase XerD
LAYETSPSCLNALSRGDLEAFVRVASQRRGRESLQHVVARLRSFARFLGGRGDAPPGLETQIDTPRVYRGERLPRCLPWETVRSFLSSIDRSTRIGVRDYAIFLLMATYGLRCCEIVALKLSDIEWRSGRMEVPPCKTHSQRALPLMEPAGEALVDYIRRGRPALPYREVFLRSRAPAGPLTPDAVTKAFAVWARRCAVKIPFYGAHCLRHSYAVHLLRQGTPLKTIGDVLGHRNAESTSVYLRLAVEDLRDVALCLPEASCAEGMGEVTP